MIERVGDHAESAFADSGPAVRDGEASRLRAVFDTAVDGLIIIDSRGKVQDYNKACERLFGYTAAEVLGQNVRMLMPEPYRAEHDGYLDHYRRTGEKKIIGIGREVAGRRKDSTTFPMELSVGECGEGEDRVFVGIIRDITERKRIESELRERQARLVSILETGPDAIMVIDERGSIETFSQAAERLFGYSAAEMIGRNVSILMPTPYREAHDGYRLTGERHIIGVGRLVIGQRRDGSTFPMELAVGEVVIHGRHLFTGFVRDVTERQEREKRVQELQAELLHVSRLSAMGQMASALAHELNQPLTAVMNYVKASRRMIESQQPGAQGRIVETMDKALAQTARAGQIIRRLRAFIEKGRTERAAEPVAKVIEEAVALGLVGAKVLGVDIVLAIDPRLPPVWIDKIQVQQVVLNLVRNAVEAVAGCPQRRLTVTAALAAEGAGNGPDGPTVEITVADTGPGLDPAVASQLFTPFVTTKKSGMGLGLSISRSIVEAHGGRLWADPDPRGGVIFRFTLPVQVGPVLVGEDTS